MQTITITGNIGSDAITRTTQGGDKVTSFNVGAKNGYGRDAGTNWFRCSLWGKRGDSLAQHLLKGVKVCVTGEFSTEDYQGKQQLNIRVADVDLMSRGEARQDRGSGSAISSGGGQSYATDDDLDDHAPFATCDPAFEPGIRWRRVI